MVEVVVEGEGLLPTFIKLIKDEGICAEPKYLIEQSVDIIIFITISEFVYSLRRNWNIKRHHGKILYWKFCLLRK